ncbi:MAG: hypothetical protein WAN65_07450 [Candidatus Sulfotelmatobacter sp.]
MMQNGIEGAVEIDLQEVVAVLRLFTRDRLLNRSLRSGNPNLPRTGFGLLRNRVPAGLEDTPPARLLGKIDQKSTLLQLHLSRQHAPCQYVAKKNNRHPAYFIRRAILFPL